MNEVAIAIDAESITLVHYVRRDDFYDKQGNAVRGKNNPPSNIRGAIQPVYGRILQDLPEGVRSNANYVIWTRASVNEDDTILYNGQNYRVLHIWPRPIDGFSKAVLGVFNDK